MLPKRRRASRHLAAVRRGVAAGRAASSRAGAPSRCRRRAESRGSAPRTAAAYRTFWRCERTKAARLRGVRIALDAGPGFEAHGEPRYGIWGRVEIGVEPAAKIARMKPIGPLISVTSRQRRCSPSRGSQRGRLASPLDRGHRQPGRCRAAARRRQNGAAISTPGWSPTLSGMERGGGRGQRVVIPPAVMASAMSRVSRAS